MRWLRALQNALTRPAALPWCVWCFVFLALCASGRPKPINGDARLMCEAAESLLTGGGMAIPKTRTDIAVGPNGKAYVKYPLLTVAQCVPAQMLRRAGLKLAPANAALQGFAVGIVPHVVVATLAVGMMQLAMAFGAAPAHAALLALACVFTTPIWSAGRSLYSEALQAMLTVWTLVVWLRARDANRRLSFFLGGMLLGMCMNTKILLLVLPLAVLVDQLHERWNKTRLIGFACAALGFLPWVAAAACYSYLRYGNVLSQGYGAERDASMGFNVPLWSGLHGLLFSSGKSVFLYAPVLISAAYGVPSLWRQRRRELWLLAIPCLFMLLTAAKWWDWSGDWGWGPRLLTPVVPLACVPALIALQRRGIPRAAFVLLAAAGFVVQLSSVIISTTLYLQETEPKNVAALGARNAFEVRDDLLLTHFVPELSPIAGQLWLVQRYFSEEKWNRHSWYPWETLAVNRFTPRPDPTPRNHDLWFDKTPFALNLEGALLMLLALCGNCLVVALRAPQRRVTDTASVAAAHGGDG